MNWNCWYQLWEKEELGLKKAKSSNGWLKMLEKKQKMFNTLMYVQLLQKENKDSL